jgi:hypothetical protein
MIKIIKVINNAVILKQYQLAINSINSVMSTNHNGIVGYTKYNIYTNSIK